MSASTTSSLESHNIDTPEGANVDAAVIVVSDVESECGGIVHGVIEFIVKPLNTTSPHCHKSEEMWIIRSGSGSAVLGNQRVNLLTNDRVIVPGGVEHSIRNETSQPLEIFSFWWRNK